MPTAEILQNLLEVPAVEDAGGRHPALARHDDAEARVVELARRMGIGIDAEEAAERQRPLVPAPVEVEPPGMGIDLHRHAMRGTGLEDRFDIDVIARALQQPPARHMAEN